jgi:hypothetical protein
MGLHSNGRLLAVSANIRLGRKCLTLANILAYYDAAIVTAIKSFIAHATEKKGVHVTNALAYCSQKLF